MRKKYYSLLKRAKEKNLELNLSYEDYHKLKLSDCTYCGVSELFLKFYCELLKVNTPFMTIDRKDNNLGYTKENCVSACFLCNKIKGNFFDFDEMCSIGKVYVYPKLKKFEQEAHENFADWCEYNVVLDDEFNF
jgi:hypothetical protein